MAVDRLLAQFQLLGDHSVGLARRHQAQNLELTGREVLSRGGRGARMIELGQFTRRAELFEQRARSVETELRSFRIAEGLTRSAQCEPRSRLFVRRAEPLPNVKRATQRTERRLGIVLCEEQSPSSVRGNRSEYLARILRGNALELGGGSARVGELPLVETNLEVRRKQPRTTERIVRLTEQTSQRTQRNPVPSLRGSQERQTRLRITPELAGVQVGILGL